MRKIVVFLIVVTLVACTSIDCPVQNLVYTKYALKKADGSTDTLNTDTLWILTRRANGTDTLLLNGLCGTTATKFNLPISYTQPEDIFITVLKERIIPIRSPMSSSPICLRSVVSRWHAAPWPSTASR